MKNLLILITIMLVGVGCGKKQSNKDSFLGSYDFFGQEQIVDNLKIFIQAATQRNEALDHILLHGPAAIL